MDADGYQRLDLEEALLADALDVHQLLNLLEPAALLAVFDDQLRGPRPDPRQRFELRHGGSIEVDRRRRRRSGFGFVGLFLRLRRRNCQREHHEHSEDE
jgi:hypothetical protein